MKRPRAFYREFETFVRVLVDELAPSVGDDWASIVRDLLDRDVHDAVLSAVVEQTLGGNEDRQTVEDREVARLARYRALYRGFVIRRGELAERRLTGFIDELGHCYSHEIVLAKRGDVFLKQVQSLAESERLQDAHVAHVNAIFEVFDRSSDALTREMLARRIELCDLLATRVPAAERRRLRGFREQNVRLREAIEALIEGGSSKIEDAARNLELMDLDAELWKQLATIIASAAAGAGGQAWASEGMVQIQEVHRAGRKLVDEIVHRLPGIAQLVERKRELANTELPRTTDLLEARWRIANELEAELLSHLSSLPIDDLANVFGKAVALVEWWIVGVQSIGDRENRELATHLEALFELAERGRATAQQLSMWTGELDQTIAKACGLLEASEQLRLESHRLTREAASHEARLAAAVAESAYIELRT